MLSQCEAVQEALTAFKSRECDVLLLDPAGQPQIGFYGRLTGAGPIDDDGDVIGLEFETLAGGAAAGGVTLTADATAEWREDEFGRCLVIDLGDDRELLLCTL